MISVIIPVHNGEKYVKTCVDSILCQTYTELEIIIVENASTDATFDICKQYEKENPCIRVISTNQKGVSHARNLGIGMAKGEYISFVDADDYVSPFFFEKLYKCVKNNDSDFAFCNCIIGTEKDHSFLDKKSENKVDCVKEYSCSEFYYNTYMKSQTIFSVVWNKLIRKDCIGDNLFDEKLGYVEDRNFIIRCVCSAKKICYLNEDLYYYWRGNETSICGTADMYTRMAQVYALQKDLLFFEENFPGKKIWQEYVSACLLQNADYRMKRAKEEKMIGLQKELYPIIGAALKRVQRAQCLRKKDKIRFLTEHYSPELFCFLHRILKH